MSDGTCGTLARLTRDALRVAQTKGLSDVRRVAEFLYRFNSVAPTERWQGELTDAASIARALGAGRGTATRALLKRHWREAGPGSAPGWRVWIAGRSGDELGAPGPELKLYLSPSVEVLRPVFEAAVEVLAFSRARALKVGADAAGLLRPDKIVIYFSDLGDLSAAAHRLVDRLQGFAAQGVPFTSEIGCRGLLSWSVDPPATAGRTSRPPPTWRAWITRRAALALVAAQRQADARSAPWRRALDQLRREGVDVERWLPAAAQWASPSAWR